MFGMHLLLSSQHVYLVFYVQNSEVPLLALFTELYREDFSFRPGFVLTTNDCLNSFDFFTFSNFVTVRCLFLVFLFSICNCCLDFMSVLCIWYCKSLICSISLYLTNLAFFYLNAKLKGR